VSKPLLAGHTLRACSIGGESAFSAGVVNIRDLTFIAKKLRHKKNVAGLIRLLGRIRNPAAVVAIVRSGKAPQLRLRFAGRTLRFSEVTLDDLANIYEIFGKEIYRTEHTAAATIVDLGAYRGFYVAYAYTKYPRATIYAFEPFQPNYVQLRANAMLNALAPHRLKMFDVAVSSQSGTVDLFGASDSAMLHSTVFESADQLRVPATTVRGIMIQHGLTTIDILKIDVEGAEFDIFTAMDDTTLAHIGTIVAELHVVPGHPISDIVDHLATKRFTLESVDKTGLIFRFERRA
jgi:FkbM family methyltransferase